MKENNKVLCKEQLTNVIKSVFKEVINENVSLINERWSYSEEIENSIDILYDAIGNSQKQFFKIATGIGLYKGKTNVELFGMVNIRLIYYMYYCGDDDICRYVMKNGYSENNYSEENKALTLTICTVRGNVIKEPTERNIVHELEHILQISKGKKK